MRSIWYSRERRTQHVVHISFEPGWNNVAVIYEDELLGELVTRSEMEAGQRYTAKDGSELTVKLPSKALIPEVYLDGKKLLVTPGNPIKVARTAFGVILCLGVVNSVVGMLALLSDEEVIQGAGSNASNLIYGIVFIGLSVLVWRGSVIGLATAVVVYATGSGLWLYSSKVAGVPISTGAALLRVLLLLFLLWNLNVLWQATPKRSK